MNTSAALRLLAAANDDAVLASWAAVFDEHKMSPECDVSPYDCWEVLQEFLSSGALSPLEYDAVNLKTAFFNGTRPSTSQIQEVLGRLTYLRANQSFDEELPVSKAKPPTSAFSNTSALIPRENLAPTTNRGSLGAPRPNPGLAAFQPRREVMAPEAFQSLSQPPPPKAFATQPAQDSLDCRKVDASLYRGVGEFNVQIFCCNQEMIIADISDDVDQFDCEPEDRGGGFLNNYMFHTYCQSCGAHFHASMERREPQ